MKKLLATTIVSMAMAGTPAFAVSPLVDNSVNNSAAASAAAAASASARASARQGQIQGQIQGQSIRASQRQTNRQANSQTTVYEDQRPSGIAPSIGLGGFASGPCVGVTTQGGFGVGLPGGASFGGSAGRSELDDECTRRETARILHMMGQQDLAIKVMMASPTVQSILPKPAAAVTPATVAPAAAVSSKHPACSPTSWATAETRKSLGC